MAEDSKLAPALRQAKQQPMFFAFVAKGATEGGLVAKKKIAAKEINEAKEECGSKKVYRGRCVTEDGKLVFEMAKDAPGTLAKQLKAVIHESAGMMSQVETRVAANLEDNEDNAEAEDDQIPDAPPLPSTAPPTPSSAPPQPSQDAARFSARLKALLPIMQKVEASAPPSAKDAKLAISEANLHFRAGRLAEANETLDAVEDLLKQALAEAVKSKPTPNQNGQQPDPGAARVANRLKALAPIAAARAAPPLHNDKITGGRDRHASVF